MSVSYRAVFELVVAGAALVGAGLSWLHSHYTIAVAPVTDGQPVTTSVVYDPQLLLLAFLLTAFAGVLAVLGAARLWRSNGVS